MGANRPSRPCTAGTVSPGSGLSPSVLTPRPTGRSWARTVSQNDRNPRRQVTVRQRSRPCGQCPHPNFIFFLTTRTPVRYYDGMNGVRVVALVNELAAADPATCDRRGLADLVAKSQQVRGRLDALEVRIVLGSQPAGRAGRVRGAVVTAHRRRPPGSARCRAGSTPGRELESEDSAHQRGLPQPETNVVAGE